MPRLEEEHDVADAPVPQRSIIITSSPRSGSNLVCRMLWDTGLGGLPDEYLDTVRVRHLGGRWGVDGFAAPLSYIQALVKHRTAPNGVFAIKMHWHQYEELLAAGLDLAEILPHPVFVRTDRRDLLRQAMSYARALATGEFSSDHVAKPDPPFDLTAISRDLDRIERWEMLWDAYYAQIDVTPHRVVYEDFTADLETSTRDVLRHCLDGLDIAADIDDVHIPEPSLKKQVTDVYSDWNTQFADALDELAAMAAR